MTEKYWAMLGKPGVTGGAANRSGANPVRSSPSTCSGSSSARAPASLPGSRSREPTHGYVAARKTFLVKHIDIMGKRMMCTSYWDVQSTQRLKQSNNSQIRATSRSVQLAGLGHDTSTQLLASRRRKTQHENALVFSGSWRLVKLRCD